MSDNNQSGLTNPQVMTAIITGVVTVVVAVIGFLPQILSNTPSAPAPTLTPIVITATFPPATNTVEQPTVAPTNTVEQPTTAPTNTVEPPTAAPTNTTEPPTAVPVVPTTVVPPTDVPVVPPTTAPTQAAAVQPTAVTNGNTRLFYDSDSFTLLNRREEKMDLRGVVFRSESGEWDARDWGPGLYNKLPERNCFRLRDATVGNRTPPSECDNIYGLILVGAPAMFWKDVDSFEVYQDDTLLGTCSTSETECVIDIPQ